MGRGGGGGGGGGGVLSNTLSVSNGVRQGGLLSPYLFNVYMDGLSTLLTETGCMAGEIAVNHLMYADDIVPMSPSATGLQKLLGGGGGGGGGL